MAPLEHGHCWRLEKNYRNRYLLMCNTTANLSNTSTHSLTLSFQVQRSCKNNAASIVVMRSNHHAYGILSCQYLYQNTRGLFSTRNNSKIYTIDTKWSKAMTQTDVLFMPSDINISCPSEIVRIMCTASRGVVWISAISSC